MNKLYKTILFKRLVLFISFSVLLPSTQIGCVKKIAIRSVSKALSSESGTVFTGDNDPALIGDALPFAIKTYESLLAQNPHDAALLLATGKALCTYAYLFVQTPADRLPNEQLEEQLKERIRAKKLFLRARHYLLNALETRHSGMHKALLSDSSPMVVNNCTSKDTSILYWTGIAWMAAISIDKFDLTLALSTQSAIACLKRAMVLNDSFGDGALHDFFVTYYGSLPASMGGSIALAQTHYKKSIAYGKGMRVAPYIAYATAISIKNQNRKEFKALLDSALAIDAQAYPSYRLANTTGQEQAQWLLTNIDNYFLDEMDTPSP